MSDGTAASFAEGSAPDQASSLPLHTLDAGAQARLVREGGVTATRLVEASLARIAAVNPAVNAIVRRMDDEALAAAAAADRAVAEGRPLGPLHGVPVTIKINIDQQGHPTDNGTAVHRDLIAPADNPVVAHLKRAGAIVVGRTNAPVYSMRWFTDNTLHGPTYNPWHRDLTVGGSSGGAAASVATGMVAIAHGNDIGGSVRFPAMCNGLVGLRPSYGRVPSFNATARGGGSVAAQLMAVQGPLARTVRDTETAFRVMAVPHVDDPRTRPMVGDHPAVPRRAAVVSTAGWPDCHPAVKDAVDRAATALAAAGWAVEEVVPPSLDEIHDMWAEISIPDIMTLLAPAIAAAGDENIRTAVDYWQRAWPRELTQGDALAAVARRHGMLRLWQRFFESWPVLVMPVSLEPAFHRLADIRSPEDARRIMRAQGPLMVISVLGLPGLTVPTGLASFDIEGHAVTMPCGVQLVAAPEREDLCFAAGYAIEAAMPRLGVVDPRPGF